MATVGAMGDGAAGATAATGRRRRPYAARVPIDVRREQLLDAALAVIVRDGYAGVSIDAIAREAGVTRPVVYGAYDGLGALLFALLDRQQARALAGLEGALPDPTDPATLRDPRGALLRTVRTLVERVSEDPDTWRPILLAAAGTPAEVAARIEGDRERFRGQLAGILGLGLAAARIDADADLLAHAVLAVMERFGGLVLGQPDVYTADRLVTTVDAVLAAVGVPPAQ